MYEFMTIYHKPTKSYYRSATRGWKEKHGTFKRSKTIRPILVNVAEASHYPDVDTAQSAITGFLHATNGKGYQNLRKSMQRLPKLTDFEIHQSLANIGDTYTFEE